MHAYSLFFNVCIDLCILDVHCCEQTPWPSLIRTTFNRAWFTDLEIQSIIIKVEAWQHPGKHGVGGAESSISCSEGK